MLDVFFDRIGYEETRERTQAIAIGRLHQPKNR